MRKKFIKKANQTMFFFDMQENFESSIDQQEKPAEEMT